MKTFAFVRRSASRADARATRKLGALPDLGALRAPRVLGVRPSPRRWKTAPTMLRRLFAHYERGKPVRLQSIPYSRRRHRLLMQRRARNLSPEFFPAARGAGFVLGARRPIRSSSSACRVPASTLRRADSRTSHSCVARHDGTAARHHLDHRGHCAAAPRGQ